MSSAIDVDSLTGISMSIESSSISRNEDFYLDSRRFLSLDAQESKISRISNVVNAWKLIRREEGERTWRNYLHNPFPARIKGIGA